MHFHLPTYLPYYSETDTHVDLEKDNVKEIEMTEKLTPSLMNIMLLLSATVRLVCMVALYA